MKRIDTPCQDGIKPNFIKKIHKSVLWTSCTSHDFSLLCLACYFFNLQISGGFILVLRLCRSHLLYLYPGSSRICFVFIRSPFFRSSCFSFSFCSARVPGTQALDLIRKGTGGTAGVYKERFHVKTTKTSLDSFH